MRAPLERLAEAEGPITSVYLALPEPTEDARHQMEVRLRQLRDRLEAAGADPAVVDTFGLGPDDHDLGTAMAVFARGDELLLCQPLAHVEVDLVRVAPLPSLVPLLADEQTHVPHLVVLVDRVGAEIIGEGGEVEATVEGDTEHVQRVRGQGWAHRRLQQRAENTWERNAAGVAEEVVRHAEDTGARLIYVAGDVRAVGFLLEHLPETVRDLVHVDDRQPQGEREPQELIADELRRRLKTVAAEDTVAVLERFVEARGRDEAADGADETLAALAEHRVGLLLVHDDLDDEREAWFDPGSALAATDPAALRDLGVEPVAGRLVDVAVRAAALSGADVRVVPGEGPNVPADGLGALLRWQDEG